MNRYQNPALFEPLALAYVVGTLQGKARKRFERLMEQHFYLRAVTEAYQYKFMALHELQSTEIPPAHVWKAIEQQLNATPPVQPKHQPIKARVNRVNWFALALGSVLMSLIVLIGYSSITQPAHYLAIMTSPTDNTQIAIAQINKDSMQLTIKLPDSVVTNKSGLIPSLWCINKDSSMPPMRMATVANGSVVMPLTPAMWDDFKKISSLAIGLEDPEHPAAHPQSIVVSGILQKL